MIKTFGGSDIGSGVYRGLVKVKLIHHSEFSLIVPDQLFLNDPSVWFQPRTWLPSVVAQDDERISCQLIFDLKNDLTVKVWFNNSHLIDSFADGSFLYGCEVYASEQLSDAADGDWYLIDGRPFLTLFHHTNQDAKANIEKTKELWASSWNIQGTKVLDNIGYCYFTSLRAINGEDDLQRIAMSPRQKLHFLRDGAKIAEPVPANWKETPLAEDILELDVYWSSPEVRDSTIAFLVDSSALAPHHVWWHKQPPAWYEVVTPDVLRVGTNPKGKFPITGLSRLDYDGDIVVSPNSMVVGDASTLHGLAAPMSEEDTQFLFKIHRTKTCPLKFWFSNPHQDHFSGIEAFRSEFRGE